MEVDPQAAGEANRTTFTSYYPSGDVRLLNKAFSGIAERYSYARDGRLVEERRTDDQGGQGQNKTQAYAYDENGNRTEDERGTHVYNARNQLVRSNPPGAASGDDLLSYIVDGSGAVTEKREEQGPTVTYHYVADRLLDSTTTAQGGQTTLYDYNDFGSITCAHLDGQACSASSSVEYSYDAFERRNGSSEEPGVVYCYDGLDRRDRKLTGADTDDDCDQPGSANPFDLAYLGTSELLSYEQDAGSETKRYDYDSLGRRQGQSLNGTYRSYAKDANGSVEGLESTTGESVGTYEYDPYGELTKSEAGLTPAAQENPFRFEGFYYDSGVATYDMQARTYAPEIGRFLSQDRLLHGLSARFLVG